MLYLDILTRHLKHFNWHCENKFMTPKNEKTKNFLNKLQKLSETQKMILAIMATILLIVAIFVVVGFLNTLINSKS